MKRGLAVECEPSIDRRETILCLRVLVGRIRRELPHQRFVRKPDDPRGGGEQYDQHRLVGERDFPAADEQPYGVQNDAEHEGKTDAPDEQMRSDALHQLHVHFISPS